MTRLLFLALGTFLGVVVTLKLVYTREPELAPDPGYLRWLASRDEDDDIQPTDPWPTSVITIGPYPTPDTLRGWTWS